MRRFERLRLQEELRRDMALHRRNILARQRQLDSDQLDAAKIQPSKPEIVFKTVDDGRDVMGQPDDLCNDADPIDSASLLDDNDTLNYLQDQIDCTNQFAGRDRREIDAQLMVLRAEVSELRGALSAALMLIGKSSHSMRRAKADRSKERET